MVTKLDKLLEEIDPSKIIDEIEKNVNTVVAKYKCVKNTVDNWEEYRKCLSEFVNNLYSAILEISDAFHAASEEHLFELALNFLKQEYPENTASTVYQIMHSGAEGGVYKILKILSRIMAEQISQDGIAHYVTKYLDGMTYEEQMAASKEYLEKFGDILPQNYKDDPHLFPIALKRILKEHPQMLKRIRAVK